MSHQQNKDWRRGAKKCGSRLTAVAEVPYCTMKIVPHRCMMRLCPIKTAIVRQGFDDR